MCPVLYACSKFFQREFKIKNKLVKYDHFNCDLSDNEKYNIFYYYYYYYYYSTTITFTSITIIMIIF